jgi:hypothetical protein
MPIRFRKGKPGPEQQLVSRFLDDYKNIFRSEGSQITVLVEPYAESGIPDMLFIIWDKVGDHWNPVRNSLNRDDIKIIHFISTFGKKGTFKHHISRLLGFSEKQVESSINKLVQSALIDLTNELIKLRDDAFFIKQIISVEAKISDWKNAVLQAERNHNFSSHSYVLLPEEKVSETILHEWNYKTGLLTYSHGKPVVKKRAQKSRIPGLYFSWMLNEYPGRQYMATN